MPSFEHILFPVDFSGQSHAVAPYVVDMATRHRARVTMLHVDEGGAAYPSWPVYGLGDVRPIIEERKQMVQSFLTSEFETVQTVRLTLEGDAGRTIADYAAKEKVDLIMMPTHGYRALPPIPPRLGYRQGASRFPMPGLDQCTRV